MSQQGVTPYDFQADILDTLTPAMKPLAGSLLKLLKAPIALDEGLTMADLDLLEADFVGYSSKVVTAWQAAAKGPDGLVRVDGTPAQWLATAITTPNTIYGVYMVDAMEAVLQQIWLLDAPIVMGVDLLQAVDWTPSFYWRS